jgi:23S rRNA (guanosine2251-2'-O)-methyltransferase
MKDTQTYLQKKAFFDKVLTIYGRNSVLEALKDKTIKIYKLHLSSSNKSAKIIDDIISLAIQRDIEIAYHDKQVLSRISKNSKQDQGVALDIVLEHFINEDEFLQKYKQYRVLALDSIHNPQNLGMIIRSATAGNIDAIIIPSKGTSAITPLVIKASVGTIFRMPIIKTSNLKKTLQKLQKNQAILYTLSSHASYSYKDETYTNKTVFILGNETTGVSKDIESISDKSIFIPMKRGVESLNVAVSASLISFM